ncbi:MAG: CbiX/SirB N-terminal domain-containing protein [Nitrospira sp.]|nr:CbiX/SirB N-terminal domain-containing protein [Nitrospira sp.]
MATQKQGVILVGHGGLPSDCPQEFVTTLKRLEAQRRAAKQPPSAEEVGLDMKIRRWPRTPSTDPYQSGLQALAARLQSQLNGILFALAYNEFCAPTVVEAVEHLVGQGATEIIVTTTMFTPGGFHSEIEIPEILSHLRPKHPGVVLRYAWPFDLELVADTLAEQIRRFSTGTRHEDR